MIDKTSKALREKEVCRQVEGELALRACQTHAEQERIRAAHKRDRQIQMKRELDCLVEQRR
jgi:hypothetical protein